jgi:acetylornithine deacetylase
MYAAHHGVLADAAILGEPTGLRIQTGNSSYAFARVTTRGMARHTWSKEHGDDAIDKSVRVLDAVRNWEAEFEASHPHPRMGTRIGFGAIRGGNAFQPAVNPARSCTLYLDFRFPPEVTIMDLRRQVRDFLDGLEDGDPALATELDFYLCRNGYEIGDDEPLVQTVEAAHRAVFDESPGRPEPYRYAVSADTSILHDYGVPALTYGPGGVRKDGVYDVYDQYGELVSIDNLMACTKVYALSAVDFCGTP